jgi:hypothetical protein
MLYSWLSLQLLVALAIDPHGNKEKGNCKKQKSAEEHEQKATTIGYWHWLGDKVPVG